MYLGENSETLTANVSPSNATNRNVTWSSSDPSVATVGRYNGVVTAQSTGSATITATTVDGGFTASCEVFVTTRPPTGITLNRNTTRIFIGESETLTATVLPTNAFNQNVTWWNSNPEVATIDNWGNTANITAVSEGTTTIIATTYCGGFEAIATVRVDEGVLIDGIRWATRNVDASGTFAATPESAGQFYQWNRLTPDWTSGWTGGGINVTSWATLSDPCPTGWRVPTTTELQSLYDAGSVWITQNGVNGRLFGIAPNQIFLPNAGHRNTWGTMSTTSSRYWSAIGSGTTAGCLSFSNTGSISISSAGRAFGASIRCVADD